MSADARASIVEVVLEDGRPDVVGELAIALTAASAPRSAIREAKCIACVFLLQRWDVVAERVARD